MEREQDVTSYYVTSLPKLARARKKVKKRKIKQQHKGTKHLLFKYICNEIFLAHICA